MLLTALRVLTEYSLVILCRSRSCSMTEYSACLAGYSLIIKSITSSLRKAVRPKGRRVERQYRILTLSLGLGWYSELLILLLVHHIKLHIKAEKLLSKLLIKSLCWKSKPSHYETINQLISGWDESHLFNFTTEFFFLLSKFNIIKEMEARKTELLKYYPVCTAFP